MHTRDRRRDVGRGGRLSRFLAVVLIAVSAAAPLAACQVPEKGDIANAGADAACGLAVPAVRLIAKALKGTPAAPSSIPLDVLGIGGAAACKLLYESIKSDHEPRETEPFLKYTPYLATEWRIPENAQWCQTVAGSYMSVYSGLGENSRAATEDKARHTSCQFAKAVRDTYVAVGGPPPIDQPTAIPNDRSVTVFSRWAFENGYGQDGYFRMECWGGFPVTCKGGIDGTALVYLV